MGWAVVVATGCLVSRDREGCSVSEGGDDRWRDF